MSNTKVAHRMASTRVRVMKPDGTPAANCAVNFKLRNHEFLFGCGAFDALPLTDPNFGRSLDLTSDFKVPPRELFQDRMDKWTKVFNYGTLPFYWGGYEPEEGVVLEESRRNAANYLINHGAKVKGHPLCWHTVCAPWLLQYDNKTIMDKQLARIERDVTAFKGTVDIWDVINETCIMPQFDRYDNAVTRICNEYGRLTLIKEVFAATRSANPDATLLINDFNLSETYKSIIAECLDAGVQIDAIGIQTHQHQGYRGLEWLNSILERFSSFGIPMHFTENTLISGTLMPPDIVDLNDFQVKEWPSTPEGEERQEREWTEMYTTLFEHPLVEAITGWDFADGAWLNAPSGLVRADGTPKPAYYALQRLIHKTWHTDVTLTTDAEGYVILEGYRGEYEVTNTACGCKGTLTLGRDTETDFRFKNEIPHSPEK